jgi:putative hydrolase of the HAD superfamily
MRHPFWLFDLDNTLHNASNAIFPYINQSMTGYVARQLNVDSESASLVRQKYWKQYGATILGLVKHHNVDPHDFLYETHRFDEQSGNYLEDLSQLVRGERGIRQTLNRLPGRKILLTNAPKAYALKVTKELGIQACFEAIETIEDMEVHQQWRPKPDHLMIKKLLRKYRCAPQNAVLVDDTLGHLLEYSKLGIKTVWFKRHVRAYTHNRARLSLEVQSIHQLFNSWKKLR